MSTALLIIDMQNDYVPGGTKVLSADELCAEQRD